MEGDPFAPWSGSLIDGWISQGSGRLYVTQFRCDVNVNGTWYAFPYRWGVTPHVRFPYLDVHPRYGSPLRLKLDRPHRLKVLIDYLSADSTHA
ncbi:hypothetical protein [Frankia sp. KB5]|uniref:hypothetical protein n=1 Tax=Frankia sp. KB5 TaxID=683318 RepID=UPI000A10EA62|nr:hypothetical protein [Frankia sp. KB5]ORT46777.1 hypothetical protein KBI5_23370 [Frankia sp. KB5]